MGTSRHRRRTIIDRASALAAADWIRRRRTEVDDPDIWRFPDSDDLLGVVAYVERHQRVAEEVLRDDAVAVLGILNHLAGEIDRRRLSAIRLGRRTGATWPTLAGPLGVTTYQGAEQISVRLEALFGGVDGTRDESAGRELRRRPRRPATAGGGRPRVMPEAEAEMRAALGQLVAHRDDLPDSLADDVTLLRRETTGRHAELRGEELAAALRTVVTDLDGDAWTAPVRQARDRILAVLA